MKKTKIIVVGSFIADLTTFTPKFPRDGETVIGSQLKMGPGGKGSNAATAASRSGGEVVMVTKVGRDTLADICFNHYKKENMTDRYIYVSDTAETGSAIIEVNETSGQNRIIVMLGANAQLTPAEVDAAESEIAGCEVVLMQLETNLDAAKEAIRLAKKYGKTVVFNPAPAQKVPEGLFEGVDYFTPNETEAEFFSGLPVNNNEEAFAAGKKLLELGVANVIITLGKGGAAFINQDKQFVVPTTDLKAIDSTGAGDAFNGAISVALAEGMDIATAIKFANCVSSIEVTRKGTSPAMPSRQETEALLESYYGIKLS